MSQALCAGMVLGAATNLSVGPNNLMMLREGLLRGRPGPVATTVCLSNASLVLAAGLVTDVPMPPAGTLTRSLVVLFGALVLGVMAIRAFMTALRPGRAAARVGLVAGLVTTAAVVWANPLTYLELFLAPAMVGQAYVGWPRLVFFGGLIANVVLGCCLYPFVGRLIGRSTIGRGHARALDLASGVILTGATLLAARPLLLPTLP